MATRPVVPDALMGTLPVPINDPDESKFTHSFWSLDQAHKNLVEAALRGAQAA